MPNGVSRFCPRRPAKSGMRKVGQADLACRFSARQETTNWRRRGPHSIMGTMLARSAARQMQRQSLRKRFVKPNSRLFSENEPHENADAGGHLPGRHSVALDPSVPEVARSAAVDRVADSAVDRASAAAALDRVSSGRVGRAPAHHSDSISSGHTGSQLAHER